MSRELQQPLLDALDYLMTLSQESVQPAEAKAGLRFLQKQYPETGMELLWEEEAYDQSIHYDVLLSLAGKGTVSLSFCPDRALPWPLRGVNRWREMDLARVNNTILRAEQAIACLDFIWEEAPIINRLVNTCLIQEALEQDPIELSLDDRQLAIDAFRRKHKLYTAKETYRWMERHGMTLEKLEHYVTDEAVAAKLRDRSPSLKYQITLKAIGQTLTLPTLLSSHFLRKKMRSWYGNKFVPAAWVFTRQRSAFF